MRTGQRELGGPVPGVFLEAFQCAQEKREGKAHPRSVSFKQNVGGPQVQNGPHFQDSPVYQGGSLGNNSGPRGRVFSHKDPKKVPDLLRLRPVGRRSREVKGLHLPSSPLRFVHSPLELQPGHQTDKALSKISRYPSALILGRFSKSRLPLSYIRKYKKDSVSFRESRIPSELGKVVSGTISKSSLFGSDFKSRRSQLISAHGQGSTAPGLRSQSSGVRISIKKGSRTSSGFPKFYSRLSPIRKTLLKTNHSLVKPEYSSFHPRSANPRGSGLERSPATLAGHRSPHKSSTHASSRSYCRNYDRRIEVWLERGSPPPPGAWNLGGGREVILHELDGAEDDSLSAPRVCGLLPGAVRSALHRQHDSLGLPKPAGFVSFRQPMVFNQRDTGIVPGEGNCSASSPHCRPAECSGRQGFEVFTDLDRMVFGQTIFSVGLQRTWSCSRGGSFCYQRECTAAFFCLPLSRPVGGRPGLLLSGLEQVEHHLPVPSNSVSGQGGSEAVVFQRSRDSDSPPLAVSSLVPSSGAEMSESDPASSRSLSTPVDKQRPGIISADSVLETSRLDVVRNSLQRQGYSEDSIRYIVSRLKDSTDNRYQYVWTKFLEFLNANNIYHSDVSAKDVNFLRGPPEKMTRFFF